MTLQEKQNVTMKYDIKEICRCCLKNIGDMKPLYGASLNEMLHSVTNLDVTPNDGFPELLCFQCVLQLSRSYRFKEECIKSYRTILDYIDRNKKRTNSCENTDIVSISQALDDHVLCDDSHSIADSASGCVENTVEDEALDQKLLPSEVQDRLKTVPGVGNECVYKCNICCKQFGSRKQLNRHLKIHDHNKPYKCSECNKTFSEKCNLKKHFYKHSGELRNAHSKVYLCSVCGKTFKYSSSLAKHLKYHTGKNLLHCAHCPKLFAEKSALEIHQRIHTGDRPYNCQQCNRKFTQLCNLRKHLRSHNTDKISLCSICTHTFADDNLTVHMLTHSEERLCGSCGKRFASNKTLEAHMRLDSEKQSFNNTFES